MKVLIIEDEHRLADFVKKGLQESGYKCDIASDGKEGFSKALDEAYELLLIDINLPYLNGIELTARLRAEGIETPVILLTAMDSTQDKIMGLDAGADDYLVKPFEFQELLARIRSVTRRSRKSGSKKILQTADLRLDLDSRTAERGGKEVSLTAKEFSLLEFLMINKGRVISKAELFSEVWDNNADLNSSKVEVYINMLRNKIDRQEDQKLIHTVIGMGYVLRQE